MLMFFKFFFLVFTFSYTLSMFSISQIFHMWHSIVEPNLKNIFLFYEFALVRVLPWGMLVSKVVERTILFT